MYYYFLLLYVTYAATCHRLFSTFYEFSMQYKYAIILVFVDASIAFNMLMVCQY